MDNQQRKNYIRDFGVTLPFFGCRTTIWWGNSATCHHPTNTIYCKLLDFNIIYTIIYLKSVSLSVSRRSQTAGRNSCSIVSGNVSNCSHRLTVYPVSQSSRLS